MNINTLGNRLERLKRLIELDAPAFILAHAYRLVIDLAEKLQAPRLKNLVAWEKELEKQFPGFAEQMVIVRREANLEAAGFCTMLVEKDGKMETCMQPAAPNDHACASCIKDLEEAGKDEEAYEASPEGKAEASQYEEMTNQLTQELRDDLLEED